MNTPNTEETLHSFTVCFSASDSFWAEWAWLSWSCPLANLLRNQAVVYHLSLELWSILQVLLGIFPVFRAA